jgi:hypothetical protein
VAAGNATITVTTVDGGKTATCEVSVLTSQDYYRSQYLTFEIIEGGTIVWKASDSLFERTIHYSLNGGPWTEITSTTAGVEIPVSSGDKVRFYGENSAYSNAVNYQQSSFSGTATFEAYGNIMSLLSPSFANLVSLTSSNSSCFKGLFLECGGLVVADKMVLPATTLASYCYAFMFYGCTSLTTAPELPATTLASGCYSFMFNGCTSLTTAPELPATTLASDCYRVMFSGCTNLTVAPELPATILADFCYFHMFSYCTSLVTAPELPATTLANRCYSCMFYACTNLITAPELSATMLVESCYYSMFNGCTRLNYLRCMATNSGSGYTDYWLSGVSQTGSFVKNPNATWESGPSGIPTGWTVVDDTPIAIPEAVDLGLSVKWASFNLGSSAPEEYGDYYAWGETEPYYSSLNPLIWREGKETGYSWASYEWCMGDDNTLTKYCFDSKKGYNGFTDEKTELDPEDDAAHMILGGKWRMPTDSELRELRYNCDWEWTSMNGVNVIKVTGTNGNSIVFPAAGFWNGNTFLQVEEGAYCWTATLCSRHVEEPQWVDMAYYLNGDSYLSVLGIVAPRCNGMPIRPVYAE